MKGVTGKILTIVVTLVIVVFALVILYLFYNKTIPFITDLVQNIIDGIKSWICESAFSKIDPLNLGITKWLCG